MHQFKVKKLEIKPYSLGSGNISKVVESITWRKKVKGYVYVFSVVYYIVDTNGILDIHKFLMKLS